MRFEVNFVHLVTIFVKVYQCEQVGHIFVPKTFPTFRLLCILAILCNLASIYIAVLRSFMVFLIV